MGRIADWLLGPVPAEPTHTRSEETLASDPSTALVIPPRAGSGSTRSVSAGEALGVSMAYRAIQIHAVASKQLSIVALRERDGKALPIAPSLVRRPDVRLTRSSFVEQCVVSLASQGNAYWLKSFEAPGVVRNVQCLNPLDVVPMGDANGELAGYSYRGRDLNIDEVQHLSLLRVPGSLKGLGPIQAAQVELRGALDLRDYSQNWFQDSGIPNGVLKSDQHLQSDTAAQAKATWNESQGAKKGVAVLGAGLSYQPIYLSPADAQFLESQKFTVTQIARLFGVPASLMLASVEGSAQTYANVEQDWLGYVRFALMAYLVEIEDALSDLLPRGTVAKFNIEALLRADTTTRYGAHKTGIEAGFLTIPEVRAIENLPPLPETTTPKEIPND
ncbi:HK97 family phage portal protein [Microterricola gilva]|uniref:HK97 family phage portal protein n=1 Tax=Microterricola gilva TaxID=393267 RepID=A0A4Q8ARM2_9MICO|nr:phage portal protein [Microterricola gilva]RZU66755.1 HK97 family phage portal protein [Microterricola gilva]